MRFVVSVLAVVFLIATTDASAQTSAGVHYSALVNDYPRETWSGIGGFLTYTPGLLGLDLSSTVFVPGDVGGRAWQLLAGPRVGGIQRSVGLYGRVRPGFIHFSERFFKPEIVCIAIFPTPEACLADATNVALDLGFTIEAFPSPRAVLRLDIGDTMTRYDLDEQGTKWMHGLQFVAGAGIRF